MTEGECCCKGKCVARNEEIRQAMCECCKFNPKNKGQGIDVKQIILEGGWF